MISERTMSSGKVCMPIITMCACMADEKFWVYSDALNALFFRSIDDSQLTYVTYLDSNGLSLRNAFNGVIHFQGKLVFVPWYADHITVYEMNSGNVRHIDFLQFRRQGTSYNCMHYDKHLLLFPKFYERIAWLFDMENEELRCIQLNFGKYDSLLSERSNQLLFIGSCMNEDELIFSICNTNILGHLSWRNGSLSFTNLPIQEPIMSALPLGNGKDWAYLDSNGKTVYLQHDASQKLMKTEMPIRCMSDVSGTGRELAYSKIVPFGMEYMVVMPTYGNDVQIWHDGKWSSIAVPWQDFVSIGMAVEPFSEYIVAKDMVYFLPYQTNMMLSICPADGKMDCQPICIPLSLAIEVLNRQVKDGVLDYLPIFYESEISLNDLVKWPSLKSAGHVEVGQQIYREIL